MVRGKRTIRLMETLKPKQVCKIFKCSINTLKKRIRIGIYPKPIKNNMRYGFNSAQINKLFEHTKNRAPEPVRLRFE